MLVHTPLKSSSLLVIIYTPKSFDPISFLPLLPSCASWLKKEMLTRAGPCWTVTDFLPIVTVQPIRAEHMRCSEGMLKIAGHHHLVWKYELLKRSAQGIQSKLPLFKDSFMLPLFLPDYSHVKKHERRFVVWLFPFVCQNRCLISFCVSMANTSVACWSCQFGGFLAVAVDITMLFDSQYMDGKKIN